MPAPAYLTTSGTAAGVKVSQRSPLGVARRQRYRPVIWRRRVTLAVNDVSVSAAVWLLQ